MFGVCVPIPNQCTPSHTPSLKWIKIHVAFIKVHISFCLLNVWIIIHRVYSKFLMILKDFKNAFFWVYIFFLNIRSVFKMHLRTKYYSAFKNNPWNQKNQALGQSIFCQKTFFTHISLIKTSGWTPRFFLDLKCFKCWVVFSP